jgi:hypothetical protein
MAVPPERAAVEAYIHDVEQRLHARTTEGPEAILGAALRDLVRTLAGIRGTPAIDLLDQANTPGIGIPDFAAKDGPLLLGHIETKQLGVGVYTDRYTGHNRTQWENFRRLPNILYSDGREFALYRSGEPAELAPGRRALTSVPVDPTRPGALVVTDTEIDQLVRLIDIFLAWQPIAPRTLSDLADRLAPLVATLRDAGPGGAPRPCVPDQRSDSRRPRHPFPRRGRGRPCGRLCPDLRLQPAPRPIGGRDGTRCRGGRRTTAHDRSFVLA